MPEALKPSSVESREKKPEFIEILKVLAEGGSLLYFYLDGWVALHDEKDEPVKIECGMQTFLDMRAKKLINAEETRGYQASHHVSSIKSQTYRISEAGKAYLSEK